MIASMRQHLLLAFFAGVFSWGILGKSNWDFAWLFALSIFIAYQWLEERRNHPIYLVLAGITSILYAYKLSPFSWGFATYCGLGLLVYHYEKGIKWRRIPFVKSLFIAVCWFTLGIAIPKLVLFNQGWLSGTLSHLLLFFALALVEDLADVASDEGHIKTIPHYLSKSTTEVLIVLLLFLYLSMSPILSLFSPNIEIKLISYLAFLGPFMYYYYLRKTTNVNHRYFEFILFVIGTLHLLVQNKVNS